MRWLRAQPHYQHREHGQKPDPDGGLRAIAGYLAELALVGIGYVFHGQRVAGAVPRPMHAHRLSRGLA
jgi:hypothetical protein